MKNKPYTFVIIGRSGSGKGTQLKMLADYLKRVDEKTHIQSYVCGDAFRNFFKEDSTLSNQVIESVNQGFYQPDFLATTLLFRDQIFGNINNNDHLFFDGYPRSLRQLNDLKDLLMYLKRDNIFFIDIEVSKAGVMERMLLRGRSDDTKEGVLKRQEEYDRAIVPMVEEIKKDADFHYLKIDGEPLPDEVHRNVLKALMPYMAFENE